MRAPFGRRAASAVKFDLTTSHRHRRLEQVQLDGTTDEIFKARPARQVEGLWLERALRCDGHDLAALDAALDAAAACKGVLTVILAMIKGKGVSFHGGQVRLARQGHSGRRIFR